MDGAAMTAATAQSSSGCGATMAVVVARLRGCGGGAATGGAAAGSWRRCDHGWLRCDNGTAVAREDDGGAEERRIGKKI
jgi:hypothetical protein